ncbi:LacI family DNA-binding transcriptional regulator [Streptomyces bobili]
MCAVHPSTRKSRPTVARASTRPTSRDVAQAAGVSQAAVSLVLGDKWRGRVSETTAERVRQAARDLGYRPNLAARNLRLGHTRTILLVVPELTTEFFAGVYTGAARLAAAHGFGVVLYPSPEGIGPAPDPFASAPAALDGVLASSMAADALTATETALDTPDSPPPTAIVCDDDKLAAGVYKALRRRGLRVPDDVSVTGVDDIALAAALDPELTTVRLDAELFGERGMHALLAVLEGRTPEEGQIPVELVVRGSTAPPRA